MKTIKTSDLTGAALDWAVAKCEDMNPHAFVEHACGQRRSLERWCGVHVTPSGHTLFSPSTDWAQGGPIIDREHITLLSPTNNGSWNWIADKGRVRCFSGGADRSPLIAAMRAVVASKLGDEVEVPEELYP